MMTSFFKAYGPTGTLLGSLLLLHAAVSAQSAPEGGTAATSRAQATGEMDVVGYDQVKTVLRRRCVTCHNPEELRGDLNLSSAEGVTSGSGSGPVVVSGEPNQSILYTTAAHLEDPHMPPNSPRIPGSELELIRRWILGGLAEKSGKVKLVPSKDGGPDATMRPMVTAVANSISARPKTTTPQPSPMRSEEPAAVQSTPFPNNMGLKPVVSLLQPAAVTVMARHPTRPLVAVAGRGQACLYDLESRQWIGALDGPEAAELGGDVTALQFTQDGSMLLVAGGVPGLSGRVIGYDLKSGSRKWELADENDSILTLDLSADGQYLAVGGPSKVVRLYQVADGAVKHVFRKHTDWVLNLKFSPDGLLLASGDRFGGLFIWDVDTGELFQALRGHVQAIHGVCWDRQGDMLWSAGEDGQVRSWDLHQGVLRSTWDGGVESILAIDESDQSVAISGRGGKLRLWSKDGNSLGIWSLNVGIESLVFTLAGERLLAGDAQGMMHEFQVGDAEARHRFQLPVERQQRQLMFEQLATLESAWNRRQREVAEEMRSPASPMSSSIPSRDSETPSNSNSLQLHVQLAEQQVLSLQTNLDTTAQALVKLEATVAETQKTLRSLETMRAELATLLADQSRQLEQAEELTRELNKQRGRGDGTQTTGHGEDRQLRELEQRLVQQRTLLAETLKARAAIFPAMESQTETDTAPSPRKLLDQFLRDIQSQIDGTERAMRQLREAATSSGN
jgi:hypothetical protein